ncbi:hypothetical protein ACSBR1_012321 [Camellia fascicularis]
MIQFVRRSEEIVDKINELELKENESPYRSEDAKLWKVVPHVIGLDERSMPRKAIQTKRQSDDKFWDFARQFFFGLWGFRQRPYPPGRPIDVAQAIGYKKLENRYYDCKFVFGCVIWFASKFLKLLLLLSQKAATEFTKCMLFTRLLHGLI